MKPNMEVPIPSHIDSFEFKLPYQFINCTDDVPIQINFSGLGSGIFELLRGFSSITLEQRILF